MSDNTVINPGSGGDTIATEDLTTYKIPVSKIRLGATDVDGGDITNTNPLPVRVAPASTSTLSNVSGSASSVTLLSSNSARLGATIFNDSTASLYVKLGTTASTTSFTILMGPNSYYEVPGGYTGRIDGIWSSAAGAARITELSA